ncbi:MAG: UDP-N-acetylmuramate--L-alanine ligase [Candidatus Moranbacteria bacterium]|nr:UDP-N-acetylmuramate--L-alanine ligase [Candidatus Moranbacteria bacterium]
MKLADYKHIHMVGIKGAGMTALCELLVHHGLQITGSDTEEVFYTDTILAKYGIVPRVGFKDEHIGSDVDLVIYSTAYNKEQNRELAVALERGTPVMSYPEAVGMLTREWQTLAVCGTHGKTTTSALLAHTLKTIGEDPSAIIGSKIASWGGSALLGKGKHLVLEADEYQNKLAHYTPFGVILTSVDYDHPDFFATEEIYRDTFKQFVARIPRHGQLVYCFDNSDVVEVSKSAQVSAHSYGFVTGAEYQIVNWEAIPDGTTRQRFEVMHQDMSLGVYELILAGRHNALNATAVLALLYQLGMNTEAVREAMKSFVGTERRFEFLGERFGALIYDDYAHHPEEIRTTLRSFRELFPNRQLKVVFHPHTFTRTKALLQEFAQSFDDADQVIILPIYGSAREEQGGVSSEDLAQAINRFIAGKADVGESIEEVTTKLEKDMGRNDLIVTLGAGNVWEISHALTKK